MHFLLLKTFIVKRIILKTNMRFHYLKISLDKNLQILL